MAEHIARQIQLQRLIERALENFKKIGRNNLTPAKVRSRISSLMEAWTLFFDGHAALLKMISESSRVSIDYCQKGNYEATGDTYQMALDFMTEQLEELKTPVSSLSALDTTVFRANQSAFSLRHLPPISLPPFDGSVDQWEQFRDRFSVLIVDNHELSDFARMHFLTSCLTGRAVECT